MLHLSTAVLALAFSELVLALPNNHPSFSSTTPAYTWSVLPTTVDTFTSDFVYTTSVPYIGATTTLTSGGFDPVGTGSYLTVTTTITVDCGPSSTTSTGAAVTSISTGRPQHGGGGGGTSTVYPSYSTSSAHYSSIFGTPTYYSFTTATPVSYSATTYSSSYKPVTWSVSAAGLSEPLGGTNSAPPATYSATTYAAYSVSSYKPVSVSVSAAGLSDPIGGTSSGISVEPVGTTSASQSGPVTVTSSVSAYPSGPGPFNPTVTFTEVVCAATGISSSGAATVSASSAGASGEALNALSGNSNSAVGVGAAKGVALTFVSAIVAGLVF